MNFDDCPQLLRNYLFYMLTIKGRSEKTVYEYYLDLRYFLRFVKGKKSPGSKPDLEKIDITDIDKDFLNSITIIDIYEFLTYLQTQKKDNASTRSRKVSSIKGFYTYLTVKTNTIENNPTISLDNPKIGKTLPKHLTLEESLELLNSVDGDFKERDYLILTMFLNCGLRLSELCGINISNISTDFVLTVTGKGNKQRLIYLNGACIEALKNYMKVRPVDAVIDKDALFLSKRKKRISVKTVQYTVKKYLGAAGLASKNYSTHKLRHTAATLMYQHGGVDIRALQVLLGHENLGTTQIYTHVSSEQLKSAADKNPLSKVKSKKIPKE
ncbi:MAG: tyrosine recombinase XerC [Clostridia bacterium]|nr:tyrosine recombinase XerC [Clostridia bacterium]